MGLNSKLSDHKNRSLRSLIFRAICFILIFNIDVSSSIVSLIVTRAQHKQTEGRRNIEKDSTRSVCNSFMTIIILFLLYFELLDYFIP